MCMLIYSVPRDNIIQRQLSMGNRHEIESLSFTLFSADLVSLLSSRLKTKPGASRVGSGPRGAKFDSDLCSRASTISAPPSSTPTSRCKAGRNPSTCRPSKPQWSQSAMQAKIIKLACPHACTRMEDARSIRQVATLKTKSYVFFPVRYYNACVYLYASTCASMVIRSGNRRHLTSSTCRHHG